LIHIKTTLETKCQRCWRLFHSVNHWVDHLHTRMQNLDVCGKTSGKIWHRKPTPSTDNG